MVVCRYTKNVQLWIFFLSLSKNFFKDYRFLKYKICIVNCVTFLFVAFYYLSEYSSLFGTWLTVIIANRVIVHQLVDIHRNKRLITMRNTNCIIGKTCNDTYHLTNQIFYIYMFLIFTGDYLILYQSYQILHHLSTYLVYYLIYKNIS